MTTMITPLPAWALRTFRSYPWAEWCADCGYFVPDRSLHGGHLILSKRRRSLEYVDP